VTRDVLPVPDQNSVSSTVVGRVDGVPVVGANELARLLGATKFWRADVRKLLLRSGERQLTFTADNPFVIVDDHTVRLANRVVTRSGELQIPVEVVSVLPVIGGWPRLAYDADARLLRVAPAAGFVGTPRVELRGGLTVLVVPSERADAAAVVGRSRARFRLRVAGGLAGVLPDSLPDAALVRDLAVSRTAEGLTFELAVDAAAMGWRLERDAVAGHVTVAFSRAVAEGFEAFASEGAPGPRVLRTVVIDPGHGGTDAGVQADGRDEKSLTLELAGLVAAELTRRAGIHVQLTRRDDRDLTQEMRAEAANHAHADAVLSLHFELLADARARGTLAWCPPAALHPLSGGGVQAAGLVALLPWRDVALERAVESRGLAESVISALERKGFGPANVRERLPLALVGVQPPGVLLECGTLSNPEERARLLAPGGLQALAVAIADGVLAWQRNE
jgi:N-acetylmuramoyl-L-alanine amidase